ncbi:MAG TPA: hypothetical protein PLP81_07705 [Saprospiraceae bacterium]|nr:hypothetical protein [Saprospiraceae bacterium]
MKHYQLKNNPALATILPEYPGNTYYKGRYISDESRVMPSWKTFFKWMFSFNEQRSEKRRDEYRLPLIKGNEFFHQTDNQLLWLGHATFLITQASPWLNHPVFGWLYGAGDGWYGGGAYGWMWFHGGGQWIWSSALDGWIAVTDPNSATLWSTQFRWLTPSQTDKYRAETTAIGTIYVGKYNGNDIPNAWVVSPRFGYVWANGDGTWFWSQGLNSWLGVTADGGIWCVSQGRFL